MEDECDKKFKQVLALCLEIHEDNLSDSMIEGYNAGDFILEDLSKKNQFYAKTLQQLKDIKDISDLSREDRVRIFSHAAFIFYSYCVYNDIKINLEMENMPIKALNYFMTYEDLK